MSDPKIQELEDTDKNRQEFKTMIKTTKTWILTDIYLPDHSNNIQWKQDLILQELDSRQELIVPAQ